MSLFGNLRSRILYKAYEKILINKIQSRGEVPKHIGVILDGNRRFSRQKSIDIREGYEIGAERTYQLLEWCNAIGVRTVTIWVFSQNNFHRESSELEILFSLFAKEAKRLSKDPRFTERRIKVRLIGEVQQFNPSLQDDLRVLESASTSDHNLLLNVALAYDGREDLVNAVKEMIKSNNINKDNCDDFVTSSNISKYISTNGSPDPDLIIRTSGEQRLSGFLLWQVADSELYFCEANWPSFRKIDLLRAILDYQNRNRRFGR